MRSHRLPRTLDPRLVVSFPRELKAFVNEHGWTFAKTMPKWPHEYLVRQCVNEGLFEQLVRHIRMHGYEGRFYDRPITYCDEAGMVYWTMGAPVAETTIINRCKPEETYASRMENDTLPDP